MKVLFFVLAAASIAIVTARVSHTLFLLLRCDIINCIFCHKFVVIFKMLFKKGYVRFLNFCNFQLYHLFKTKETILY